MYPSAHSELIFIFIMTTKLMGTELPGH